jgi:two-component system, LytTR family, response regulator
MRIRTVTIEDEEKSLYVLHELIRQCAPDLELCGSASHTGSAVNLIEGTDPHLVFMDVYIADGTGFDVLQQLSHRTFELILVTAYDNYAMDAFHFAAIDYLLKPIGTAAFEEATKRARQRLEEKIRYDHIETLLHNLMKQQRQDMKLGIATLNGFEFTDIGDIIWCQSEGAYTTFYLADKNKITSSRNLGFYEQLLHLHNFYRINHGILINMRHIKSYIKGKGGHVVMTDSTELEVSQRRKVDFLERLVIRVDA